MGIYFSFWKGKVYLQTYTDSFFCVFSNLQVKGEMTKTVSEVYYSFQVETRMTQAGVSFDRASS